MSDTDMLYMASLQKMLETAEAENTELTAEKIELKVLLSEIRPVLKRSYFADPDDTKLANVLYDKINDLIGRE